MVRINTIKYEKESPEFSGISCARKGKERKKEKKRGPEPIVKI